MVQNGRNLYFCYKFFVPKSLKTLFQSNYKSLNIQNDNITKLNKYTFYKYDKTSIFYLVSYILGKKTNKKYSYFAVKYNSYVWNLECQIKNNITLNETSGRIVAICPDRWRT